jgi:hypothetical protein
MILFGIGRRDKILYILFVFDVLYHSHVLTNFMEKDNDTLLLVCLDFYNSMEKFDSF